MVLDLAVEGLVQGIVPHLDQRAEFQWGKGDWTLTSRQHLTQEIVLDKPSSDTLTKNPDKAKVNGHYREKHSTGWSQMNGLSMQLFKTGISLMEVVLLSYYCTMFITIHYSIPLYGVVKATLRWWPSPTRGDLTMYPWHLMVLPSPRSPTFGGGPPVTTMADCAATILV